MTVNLYVAYLYCFSCACWICFCYFVIGLHGKLTFVNARFLSFFVVYVATVVCIYILFVCWLKFNKVCMYKVSVLIILSVLFDNAGMNDVALDIILMHIQSNEWHLVTGLHLVWARNTEKSIWGTREFFVICICFCYVYWLQKCALFFKTSPCGPN